MTSVFILTVAGGEDTTPAGTDAIELDDGTTSKYALLSNLPKAFTVTAPITNTGGTLATSFTTSSTDTLTNKRITRRKTSETSSATPTINTDNADCHQITALAAAITSFTSGLSGTPTDGQELDIEVLDDATARAITWGTSFASGPATLPTTTVLSKWLYVKVRYSSSRSKWVCMATGSEQ